MRALVVLLCLACISAGFAERNKFAELVQKVRDSATEMPAEEQTSEEDLVSLLQVGEGKYIPPATLDPKYSMKPTILGKGTVIDRPFKPKKVSRTQLHQLKEKDRLSFERSKWVTRRMKKIIGDDSKMRKVNIHTGGVAKIMGKSLDGKFPADFAGNGKYVEATIVGYTPQRPVAKKQDKFIKPEMAGAKALFRKEVKARSKKNAGKFNVKPSKTNKPVVNKKSSKKNAAPVAINKAATPTAAPAWSDALKAAVAKVEKIRSSAKQSKKGKQTAAKPKKSTKVPLTNKLGKALAARKAEKIDWKNPDLNAKLTQILNKLAMQDAFEDVLADEQSAKLNVAAEKAAEAAAFGPALMNGQNALGAQVIEKLDKAEKALHFLVEKAATDDILIKAATSREAVMNNKINKLIKAIRYLVAKQSGLKVRARRPRTGAKRVVRPRRARVAAAAKPKAAGKPANRSTKRVPSTKKRVNRNFPKRSFPKSLSKKQQRVSIAKPRFAEEESSLEDAVNEEMHRFMADADAAEEEAMAAEEAAVESDAEEEEEETEEEEELSEEEQEEEAEEESEEEEEESEEEEQAEEESEDAEESFVEVASEVEEEEEAEDGKEWAKVEGNLEVEEGDIVSDEHAQRSEEEMMAQDEDEDIIVKLAEQNAAGAFIEEEAEAEEEEEEAEAEEEEEEVEAEEEEEEAEAEEEEVAEEEQAEETVASTEETGNAFIDNNENVKALRASIAEIQNALAAAKAENARLQEAEL